MNMTRSLFALVLLVFAVLATCDAENASTKVKRAPPTPEITHQTLFVFDRYIMIRLCTVGVKYTNVTLHDVLNQTKGMWIFYFNGGDNHCRNIVLKVTPTNETYSVAVAAYDVTGIFIQNVWINFPVFWCPWWVLQWPWFWPWPWHWPWAVCFGEPHFKTMDGYNYTYHGDENCVVTLVKDCRPGYNDFSIHGTLEKSPLSTPGNLLTRISKVDIYVNKYNTNITLTHGGVATVNGTVINSEFKGNNITIVETTTRDTKDDLEQEETVHVVIDGIGIIEFNGKFRVEFTPANDVYIGNSSLCGMYGTADEPKDTTNDFLLPNGTYLTVNKDNAEPFGDSWKFCP